jgi:hypothetical protein
MHEPYHHGNEDAFLLIFPSFLFINSFKDLEKCSRRDDEKTDSRENDQSDPCASRYSVSFKARAEADQSFSRITTARA